MIYIDTSALSSQVPAGWHGKATLAQQHVEHLRNSPPQKSGTNPARPMTKAEAQSKAIKEKSAVWSEVKPALSALSNGKCWYCESREVRSYCDVDHFRPKNGVDESSSHEGYWWLAFELQNYRFSCVKCNRRSKGIHFPLIDESNRYTSPNMNMAEEPELLDPIVAGDPDLLSFLQDGTVHPAVAEQVDPVGFRRAETSIKLYFLQDPDLLEARANVFEEIGDLVEDIENYSEAAIKNTLPNAKQRLKTKLRKLREHLSREAEFAAAARNAILIFQYGVVAKLRSQGVLP